MRRIAFLLMGLLLAPAQMPAQGTELTLDFRPFSGVLSVAWKTGDAWYAGAGLGAGVDELNRTLAPNPNDEGFHSFEQWLHASAFARYKPTRRIDVDVGLRIGFGAVRSCSASDCWPDSYKGAYIGAFWGGKRWKVGPRLLVANVNETDTEADKSDNVVYLEILTGRFSVGW